jgi:hypothetical protein
MRVLKNRLNLKVTIPAAIMMMGFVFLPQTGIASASTSLTTTVSVPALPVAGSSLATWQSWASAQQAALQSVTPQSLVAPSAGCTNSSVMLVPVVSTGTAGIPAGIVTDAIQIVGSCGGAAGAPLGGNGIRPLLSSYCPNMTNCTYQSATNGEVAVGTGTVGGNANYMGAAYTYTSSGSGYTSHAELGTVSSGCSVGTLVANSSDSSLSNNQYVEILWGPRSGSNTWSGTGWHYNGSGYTNLGTVCAAY